MFSVVDLFAGVGGFSEGFASSRVEGTQLFSIKLLVDKDIEAAFSYRHNRPNVPYLVGDVATTTSDQLFAAAGLTRRQGIDVLIGGPPCQGFSVLMRNRALDDPRNLLVKLFLTRIMEVRPRIFVIENVPNLLSAAKGRFWSEIQEYTQSTFLTRATVLNACDFGVPQWRKRTFVVGFRRDQGIEDFSFPEVSQTRKISAKSLIPKDDDEELLPMTRPIITTEEAIGDLPSLHAGEEAQFYSAEPFTNYQAARRRRNVMLFNHVARNHDHEFLHKLAKIEEGGSNRDLDGRRRFDRGREIKYLSQAYGRLHRHGIAQTITAHFLNPGSGRFTHYRDLRSITVREAARFQSFDDDFILYGPTQTQQRLIGNAVPPIMSRAIAEHLGRLLLEVAAS